MSNVFASGMNVNVSIHSPAENNSSHIQITVLPPKDGAPGYTPEKGKDYFTPSDKEEIVKEVIKALPGGGGSGGGGVSSWNDLTDRPFKKEFVKLFEKKEVTFDYLEDLGGMGIAHLTSEVTAFKFDTRYKVIFNGVEYIEKTSPLGTSNPTLGNAMFDGGEDDGKPYYLSASNEELLPGYGIGLYCLTVQQLDKIEIAIYEEVLTPLAVDYIAEGYLLDLTHDANGYGVIIESTATTTQHISVDRAALNNFYKNSKFGIGRIKINYRSISTANSETYIVSAYHCFEKEGSDVQYRFTTLFTTSSRIEYGLTINIGGGSCRIYRTT